MAWSLPVQFESLGISRRVGTCLLPADVVFSAVCCSVIVFYSPENKVSPIESARFRFLLHGCAHAWCHCHRIETGDYSSYFLQGKGRRPILQKTSREAWWVPWLGIANGDGSRCLIRPASDPYVVWFLYHCVSRDVGIARNYGWQMMAGN